MSWFKSNKKNPAIVKSERAIEVRIDLELHEIEALHDLFSNKKSDEKIMTTFHYTADGDTGYMFIRSEKLNKTCELESLVIIESKSDTVL